jgi:hypothetical protein
MPSEKDDLFEKALEALRSQLRGLAQQGIEEAAKRIESLATTTAYYWRLVAQGKEEEAKENLKWVEADAKLFAARWTLLAHALAVDTVERIILAVAQVGGIALRGLLAM